jgi:geranylgeranyl pyrophosphate synthase
MLLRLMRLASDEERSKLMAVMNKRRGDKSEDDVRYVLSLMTSYGTIEYAQKRAMELVEEALGALNTIEWRGDSASIEILQSAAKFAVERKW